MLHEGTRAGVRPCSRIRPFDRAAFLSVGGVISSMRLFHFSENAGILRFEPRPVLKPALRRAGQEWLNGPLVWAIAEDHQRLYLFPRECPRIVIWPHDGSSQADREKWLGDLRPDMQAVACIESAWAHRVATAHIHRYEFPRDGFESIEDAGMHVSRDPVLPIGLTLVTDLPEALRVTRTELRVVDSLLPLRGVWDSSLHASGIRLRNAEGWRSASS